LLGMIALETREKFRDEGLNVEIDLSHVNWILTANDTRNLDWPLLSRLKTVMLPNPSPQHAEGLVDFILRKKIAKPDSDIPAQGDLEPEVRAALVRAARLGASPRTITAMVEKSIAIKMQWQRKKLH
jgi:ATP-dependent Lon protease